LNLSLFTINFLGQEDEKKIFSRHHHQNLTVGGRDFLEKNFFCQKKNFFDMKNIENSVSKTLREKLRQV